MASEELPVAANAEAADYLVVYLDASESMKGFVAERQATEATSAQSVFSKSLLELRNVVNTLSPQPKVILRVIDVNVHPPADAFQLAQYAINRDWYRGKETNLAYAFKAFQEAVEKKQPAAESSTTPARFHILVTDGVQSTKEMRSDVDCLQGSDSHCVKERINELLSKGWGGTILGIRSDFNGEVFSEIRPHWSIQYASETDKPETYRPFYLYLFSPDQAALDKLVKVVKDGLRPLLKSSNELREYPLTSRYVTGKASGDLIANDKESFTVSKEKDAPAESLCFNVSVAMTGGRPTPNPPPGDSQTTSVAPLQLTLRVPWSKDALDSGMPQEVAGMVKWELTPVASDSEKGARYPEMKIVGSMANTDGSVTIQLAAKWADGVGKRRERVYCLIGRLDTEKSAPPWVAQWSTDTDIAKEEATRTLNLKTSLANLWDNQFLRQQEFAKTCLRVGDL